MSYYVCQECGDAVRVKDPYCKGCKQRADMAVALSAFSLEPTVDGRYNISHDDHSVDVGHLYFSEKSNEWEVVLQEAYADHGWSASELRAITKWLDELNSLYPNGKE